MFRALIAAVFPILLAGLPPAWAAPESWSPFAAEVDQKGQVVGYCSGPSVTLTVEIDTVEGRARGQLIDAFGVDRENFELTPGLRFKGGVTLVGSHLKILADGPTAPARVSGRYGCE